MSVFYFTIDSPHGQPVAFLIFTLDLPVIAKPVCQFYWLWQWAPGTPSYFIPHSHENLDGKPNWKKQ